MLTSSLGISKFAPPSYFRLVGPGLRCLHCLPSSSCSHAARASALVVSTTSAALAFQSVERCLHPSCRPWGSRRLVVTCLSTTSDPPTRCRPSKCSPHPQRPPASHLLLLAQRLASRLVAPLSPLAHVRRLSALLRCMGALPRPQGVALVVSPLRLPPKRWRPLLPWAFHLHGVEVVRSVQCLSGSPR